MAFTKQQNEKFMRLAIAAAARGIRQGQAPFGAAIIDNKTGKAVLAAHNTVWKNTDITAHGEITAIRLACKKLRTIGLSGCTIYSTCEPCPMCFSAIHWAGIRSLYFGASIQDAKKCGFSELEIRNATMKRLGKSRVKISQGLLKEECKALFGAFRRASGKKRLY